LGKPERGTKRQCLSCASKFYDLNRDPIVCPSCSAPFVVVPRPASRAKPDNTVVKPTEPAPSPAPAAAAEVNSPVDPEDLDKDEVEEVAAEVEDVEGVEDIGGDVANAFVEEEEDPAVIGIEVNVENKKPT
jgi:uncharacterized protein (TIGR02300 family)